MAPANYTMGALLLAFIIYTTMKGNLRGYLQIVGVA